MKLSLNTSYLGDTGREEHCLRSIKAAGFDSIQWIHDWNSDYMYAPSEMEQIADWLSTYGLVMGDLHASKGIRKDYMSFNEYERKAGVELIENRVDLAARCGARVIVLHMPIPTALWNSPRLDDLYDRVFRSLDELRPYCIDKDVRIAIENLVQTDYRKETEQFERLFERYDADFLGLCYDSGHAHCAFRGAGESVGFLERFADRLLSVHLTDNDGRGDAHWVPFSGTVDWTGIARVLVETGYDGYVALESVLRRSGLEDESVYLEECFARAERFRELAERFR